MIIIIAGKTVRGVNVTVPPSNEVQSTIPSETLSPP